MKKQNLLVMSLIVMFYSTLTYAKGTTAYVRITNWAKVYAQNFNITNAIFNTNVVVAEIHGIVEFSSNTNLQYGMSGKTNMFWFSITNRGNIEETNLHIFLTNYNTNSAYPAGDWIIGLLDSNSNIIWSTNSYSFTTFLYSVTNSIPIDTPYKFAVILGAPASVDPNAWVSVDMKAYLQPATNISYYTSGGITYGGFTNIYRTCRVEMAWPVIMLIKEIEKITNIITGGYELIPGCEIWYRVSFSNSGNAAGKNLTIIDILPPDYIMFTNYFVLSNFATNLSIRFSADNGISWLYNPINWDTNVNQIKFEYSGIIPAGEKGIIKYKVKIK